MTQKLAPQIMRKGLHKLSYAAKQMNKCILSCENDKNLLTQNPEFPSISLG